MSAEERMAALEQAFSQFQIANQPLQSEYQQLQTRLDEQRRLSAEAVNVRAPSQSAEPLLLPGQPGWGKV